MNLSRVRVWIGRLLATIVIVILSLVIGGGVQAVMNLPDLQPWHNSCRAPN